MSVSFKEKIYNKIKKTGIITLGIRLLQPKQTNNGKIHFKSKLLEESAIRKQLSVKRISNQLVLVSINGRNLLFDNMEGPSSSNAIKNLCDDKYLTRKFLEKEKVSIPVSSLVKAGDLNSLKEFANKNGYPMVLKPVDLSQGRGVITGIYNEKELKKAQKELISLIMSKNKKIFIEKEFQGSDYRFFIVNNKVISVTKRMRPNVIGDGVSTIKELIDKKNQLRMENRYLKNHLIPTEYSKLDNLKYNNLVLTDIPPKDEIVILRTQSNLSGGGDSIDFTNRVHPEFIKIAKDVMKAMPGINYCGIDFMTKDITKKPSKDDYIVTELEFSPGPVSMFPIEGSSYDMAGEILDYYIENY